MIYRNLGTALGVFSIALGAAEMFAPKRLGRVLGAPDASPLVRGFGAREVVTGVGLLAAPTEPALVWGRVAGDAMDLAALGLAARRSPRNRWVWGAIAAVVGVTIVDVMTARGLEQTMRDAPPTVEAA